jgi:uncharacterized membrane protein YdbT with pleckstrin-like domain
VIGPVAIGIAQVTSKRLISEWGFELRQTARGLRLTRGLLSRTTQTVPLDRVQGIAIVEPLLWRPAGWCRVEVSVAGHARSNDRERQADKSTLLPVADLSTAGRVVADVIPAQTSDRCTSTPLHGQHDGCGRSAGGSSAWRPQGTWSSPEVDGCYGGPVWSRT